MLVKLGVISLSVLLFLQSSSRAQSRRWEALYSFGDSYSDSGAGYIDGNGPTAVVYLANDLGIPFTFAGDPDKGSKSLNFAVSAAQTGSGEGTRTRPASAACSNHDALFGRGIRTQVLDFAEGVKSGKLQFDPKKTLFFIAGGLNDGALPTETTIANLTAAVQQLYIAGGRYFLIAILPEKVPVFHAVAARLNPALSQLPGSLHERLPDAHFALSKWGSYFDDIMEHPGKFGIANVSDKCAGRALMGEDPTPCTSPETHFFYHDGHPSTAVHRIVGRRLSEDLTHTFPSK